MSGESRPYPWKVFLFLWLAGTLTTPLLVFYLQGLVAIAPL